MPASGGATPIERLGGHSNDPIVPQAGNPQALNRYSYCIGNPLKYTDPSGHFIILPALALIAVVAGGAAIVDWSFQVSDNMYNGGMSFWDAVYHPNLDEGEMIQTAAVAGSTAAVAVTAGPALVTMAGYDLMTIGAATGSTTLFSAGTSTVAAGGTIAATLWGVGQATHPTPAAGEGYNDRLRITEQYEYGECFQCAKAMNDTFGDPVTVVHNASRNFPDDLTFYGANGEPIGSTGYHMYTRASLRLSTISSCSEPACRGRRSIWFV